MSYCYEEDSYAAYKPLNKSSWQSGLHSKKKSIKDSLFPKGSSSVVVLLGGGGNCSQVPPFTQGSLSSR